MGRGKPLSENEKGQIEAFRKANYSRSKIAKELKRSIHVISNYINAPEDYGIKKSPGRKKKLSAKQVRLLVRKASSGKFSANQLRTELNLTVSKRTVQSYLNASKTLKYEKRLKVPALQEHHKVARVQWAKTMLTNREGWTNIIFSDEKKFNLDGPDGCQFYWHDLRLEKESFFSRNHGGGTVMIWAGMSQDGLTNLAFLKGRQTSADYVKVLQNNLLPFAKRTYGSNWVFQQDNAPIHTSKLTRGFFQESNIRVLSWPARSPDLNPIENAWGMLARQVYKGGRQFHSESELEDAIRTAWNELEKEFFRKLISSMDDRCFSIIEKNGNIILY